MTVQPGADLLLPPFEIPVKDRGRALPKAFGEEELPGVMPHKEVQ